MAWGSGDYAYEDAQLMHKLDDLLTEARGILALCKSFIETDDKTPLAKRLMLERLSAYESKFPKE